MTPNKGKRPLPSSPSFVFPERPTTYQQWKIALQRVKILYLRGQWKECAFQCSQFLSEARTKPLPLHATYLHFYCALSNEAIARLSHPLSIVKLHILEQAKASYEAAASSLPLAHRVFGLNGTYDDDSWSTPSTSSSKESGIVHCSQSSPDASSPRDDPSSPSSVELEDFPQETIAMKPWPLRIRKSSLPSLESTVNNPDHQLFFHAVSRPPSTPSPTHRPSTAPDSRPSSFTLAPSSSVWLQVCARERYDAYLIVFTEMLSSHISTVNTLMQKTQEAQAMRYFAKRLASYGEDEAAREADLQARMVRLKAAGWRRERFRPEGYQDLCQRALEEL